MRDYGKVHTSFWSSPTITSMSEDARMLAMYLITAPHSTIAGVFRLPNGYVCEDLKWDAARVEKGFSELLAKGYANRCETTKWVWVCKHLEWNKPENPNQCKSAAKIAMSIPDECAWKPDFMRVSGPLLGIEWVAPLKPCETLAKPFLNQEQEQEQDTPKGVQGGKPPKPPALAIPDWIPVEPWNEFVAMRRAKGKRAPFTVAAAKGILSELEKLRSQGQDIVGVLHQSVRAGWSDVYAVKSDSPPSGGRPRNQNPTTEDLLESAV